MLSVAGAATGWAIRWCGTAARWAARSRTAAPHGDLPGGGHARAGSVDRGAGGLGGQREIAADDFFTDYYTTALGSGELVTSVRIPGSQGRGAYVKFNRRTLDWALVGVAVSHSSGASHSGLTGVAPTAVRARGVEQALASGASPADASMRASEGLDPPEGLDGSAEYKRHLATVLVRRAWSRRGKGPRTRVRFCRARVFTAGPPVH